MHTGSGKVYAKVKAWAPAKVKAGDESKGQGHDTGKHGCAGEQNQEFSADDGRSGSGSGSDDSSSSGGTTTPLLLEKGTRKTG